MRDEPATLRAALFDELDASGSITKSRIRNLLIRYPETGPRTITTVEELDALPLRSIVMNDGSNPHAWQKRTDVHVGDAWYLTSDTDYGMDSYAIFEDGESATVLYVPEPTV